MIHLVLGGARSGKSSYAEQLATESALPVTVVATATAGDEEMRDRIARHQLERPNHWGLIEEPLDLTAVLENQSPDTLLLIDCLTLWLSNHLLQEPQPDLHGLQNSLCDALKQCSADVVLVSNEVGMGIVPMGAINRKFVDHAGWLNQAVADVADRVSFVAAGLPLQLKG